MSEATPTITVASTSDRFRQTITTRQFQLTADEPTELGGTDAGPTPTELVIAGLGACKAITLKMYAERKQWPLEAVSADMQVSKSAGRYSILVQLRLTGDLSDEQRTRLLDISNKCPVHKMLAPGTDIDTVLL
ncbi:MAG: OsmC family protein [Cyanobacteria bacterium P01_D01_bin.105]